MQISAMVEEGLIHETDEGLEVQLELKDGVLLVNEKEMVRF